MYLFNPLRTVEAAVEAAGNQSISQPAASGIPWKEFITIAPHFLWVLVLLAFILFLGPRNVREMFLSARKLGFGGFELELTNDLAAAAENKHIVLPRYIHERVARRLKRLRPLLSGARVLWLDDHPEHNEDELNILSKLGVIVDIARTDRDAEDRLNSAVYDVVLSDMQRGEDGSAGKRFLPVIQKAILSPKIIFYVGSQQEQPPGSFGLTSRPDELLDLILDGLERRRA
jgi:CheY-like chemotaxis protein